MSKIDQSAWALGLARQMHRHDTRILDLPCSLDVCPRCALVASALADVRREGWDARGEEDAATVLAITVGKYPHAAAPYLKAIDAVRAITYKGPK